MSSSSRFPADRSNPDYEKWFLYGKTTKIDVNLRVKIQQLSDKNFIPFVRGVLTRKRAWVRMMKIFSERQQKLAQEIKDEIDGYTDSSESIDEYTDGESSGLSSSDPDCDTVNCRGQRQTPMEGGMNAYGRLKKGGMVKGKKGEPVHIIAHAGELVVPANVVPQVLKSNAWINHVKDIQQKHKISYKEAMVMAKGTYKKAS